MLLCLCLLVVATGSELKLDPVSFLGSKAPYAPQQSFMSYEAMPPQCKLVHVVRPGLVRDPSCPPITPSLP